MNDLPQNGVSFNSNDVYKHKKEDLSAAIDEQASINTSKATSSIVFNDNVALVEEDINKNSIDTEYFDAIN